MIDQPYLLIMTLPCYVDAEGRRYLEELWHKDLVAHLEQIGDLTLAAPLLRSPPGCPVVAIDHDGLKGKLRHLDLPPCRSSLATLRSLPTILGRLWSAIGRASIVHANSGGWPISFGWFAIPMAKVRGRFALTNVESGSWRLGFQAPRDVKGVLQAIAFEGGARLCVNLSDLATFTQAGYRRSMMLPWRRHRGHVLPASWIEPRNILTDAEAEATWRAKLEGPPRPLRAVFAANLLESKGLLVLLDAMKELDRRGVAVALEIYGKGGLQDACEAAAAALPGPASIALRGTLAYGPEFFERLQTYDLMAVPSLSDEQPRVVYDCFARALPVVATATDGLVEVVTDGRDGTIVPIGDVKALADALEWAASHRETLKEYGINSLSVARGLTHDQMHARRAALIERALGPPPLVPA